MALRKLLGSAYDLTGDAEMAEKIDETWRFDEPERFTSFFALKNGEAVGSLSINKVTEGPNDGIGNRFWASLKKTNPRFYDKAKQNSTLGFNIWDFFVREDMQGQGISRELYQVFIDRYHPSFVMGITETPVAAQAITSALSANGFRTFVGTTEITSGNPQSITDVHKDVFIAYMEALNPNPKPDPRGLFFTEDSTPRATRAKPASLSGIVRFAFSDMSPESGQIPPGTTPVKPLFSIHRSLLPASVYTRSN